MKLRLTLPATRQLERILSEIVQHHPSGARTMQERIRTVMNLLTRQPYSGSATARPGVRRMVVQPYPYGITYSVGSGEIVILGVRHTSRRPVA